MDQLSPSVDGVQQVTRSDGSTYTTNQDLTIHEGLNTQAAGDTSVELTQTQLVFENNNSIIDITSECDSDFTVSSDVSCSMGTVELIPGTTQLKFVPPVGFTGTSVVRYTLVQPGRSVEREVEVHVGKSFSQAAVTDDSFQLDTNTSQEDDVEGPDMATYGLWRVSF